MIIFDNLFQQLARGKPPILDHEICAMIDERSLTEPSTQVFSDGVRTLATGSTVMHMLAFFGRGDAIGALLLKGDLTPLAAKNEEGLTPFAIAAQANDLITMRKLTKITLFPRTEPQKQLHDFDRALQEALRAGHLNAARYLVEEMECQLPLVATWNRDETLLISLFQQGHYALAAFVLAKQQDARQVSRYSGQPLLTMAVTRALAERRARAPELENFIRALLQSGAGIEVKIEDADLSRRGGIAASKIAQYLNAIIETWPALNLPDFLMLCGLTIGKIPFSQMPTKNTAIPLIFDDQSLHANRAAVMQCYDHYHAIFAGLVAAGGEMSPETQAVLRGMELLQLLGPGGLQARALAVCRNMPTHRNDTALATLLQQADHLKQERQALIDRLEQIVQSEKWRRELSSPRVHLTGTLLMILTQLIIIVVEKAKAKAKAKDEDINFEIVFGLLILPAVVLSSAASVEFLGIYNQFKKLKIIAKLPECTALKLDELLPDSFWAVRNSMRARSACEALLGSHYANMLAQAKVAPLGQPLPFNIGEDHPLLRQPKTQEKTSRYRRCTGFFTRNTPSGEDGQPLLLGGQGAAYGAIDDDIEAQRHSAEEGGGGGAGPSMPNLYDDDAAGAASAKLEADHGAGAAALP